MTKRYEAVEIKEIKACRRWKVKDTQTKKVIGELKAKGKNKIRVKHLNVLDGMINMAKNKKESFGTAFKMLLKDQPNQREYLMEGVKITAYVLGI